MDTQALWVTFRLALVTTILLAAAGLPIAAWIAFTRSHLRPAAEALVALPLILPPTVLGFYLLVLMGPATAPGRWLTHVLGHPLAFTFGGLVVGSILYSLPFMVQPLASGFRAGDPNLIDAATMLGASPVHSFFTIVVPQAKSALITALVLTFAHTVGEFGVVLMIGGNLPGSTRTLSIALYDQVQDFHYAQANQTALLLLAISFVTLVVLYSRRGRSIV